MTSALLQSGYSVGTFTSPYITKFTNRFQYNNTDIPEETLLELVNTLRPLVDEIAETEFGSPTMFEVTTAVAILFLRVFLVRMLSYGRLGLGEGWM